jgi:hypothetical protein
MNKTNEYMDMEEVDEVPVSTAVRVLRKKGYGSVDGLDDSELADIHEIEKMIFEKEWGPILALPVRNKGKWIKPNIDENGHADYGAFGTVDFERLVPEFDKARYKVDMLQDEIRRKLIMADTIKERLPGNAKHLVLKYVMQGILDTEEIVNDDMKALAKYSLRIAKLQDEVKHLQAASQARKMRKQEVFLES